MQKILVTGGAGYIGAHVLEGLRKRGEYKLEVVDNFSQNRKNIIRDPNVTYHDVDIRDKEKLMSVFKETKPEVVFHFAALANVPDSVVNPAGYYDNNIVGGLNLLECMREAGTSKIIFSSAGAVYGEPVTEIIEETHPRNPTNPYGRTKSIFEEILKDYHKAYNISSVSLRYFCPAGSDLESGLGEWRVEESHVIPSIVLTLLDVRKEFFVFGDDFPTRDGTGVRDYIHIKDVVSAHLVSMDKLSKEGTFCDNYNVGINKGFSVMELIKAAEEVSGLKLHYSVKPRRPGDPSQLIANSSKLKREMLWEPTITNVNDIVRDTFTFFKENLKDLK
jgi:UDP-glucose 4-epimerase